MIKIKYITITTLLLVTTLFSFADASDGYLYSIENNLAEAYDVTTGTIANSFSVSYNFGDIAFGSDGLLYGHKQDYIDVYDVTTGTLVDSFYTGGSWNTPLAFGPDGYLYSIENNLAEAYDVTTGTIANSFSVSYNFGDIAFGSDGLLYGHKQDYIDVYDVTTGTLVDSFYTGGSWNTPLAFQPSIVPEPISSILFISGGTLLAIRRNIKRNRV
jgi:hypothetical protein